MQPLYRWVEQIINLRLSKCWRNQQQARNGNGSGVNIISKAKCGRGIMTPRVTRRIVCAHGAYVGAAISAISASNMRDSRGAAAAHHAFCFKSRAAHISAAPDNAVARRISKHYHVLLAQQPARSTSSYQRAVAKTAMAASSRCGGQLLAAMASMAWHQPMRRSCETAYGVPLKPSVHAAANASFCLLYERSVMAA
jgi:hypothetical protein